MEEEQQEQAVAADDERRTGAVLDRAYFCSLGLSDQGLDPRDHRSLEKVVSRQEVRQEFGTCKPPIDLRNARTIDLKFLESLRDKVYKRRGNWRWKKVSLAFAGGAIASYRGLQVDWATFAFEAQFRGRWAKEKASSAVEDGSKQGDGEIDSKREDDIRREGEVAFLDQVEARLVEPGSGSESTKRERLVDEMALELHDSVGEEINEKRARMSKQVATEMERASSTKLDLEARLNLQQGDHDQPGSDALGEEWVQAGLSPAVDLNTEMQMPGRRPWRYCELAAAKESAGLALVDLRDNSVVEIEPLASRIQPVKSSLEPQATVEPQATTDSAELLEESDNLGDESFWTTILHELTDITEL